MFQSLLRNWLLGQARESLRSTAQQPLDAAAAPKSAPEQGPPQPAAPPICHVGLVFALSIEAGGLVDRLRGVIATHGAGFVAREGGLAGKRLVVVESGIGAAAAAQATRALVAGHQPRWIISAGFAGGLDPRLAQGDILMADEIVDEQGHKLAIDFRLPPDATQMPRGLHVGRLVTVARIVGEPAAKRALAQRHAALAVDMESWSVAEVCRQEKIRFLSIRAISDAVDRALPRDIDNLVKRKSTAGRLGAAAGAILRRPSSIKDMWQLKEDALVASERLANFLAGVVEQLD